MPPIIKTLLFVLILCGVIPIGVLLARARSYWRDFFFFVMIFFTCYGYAVHIMPWPDYTGTSRGFALSMVDIAGWVLLFSLWPNSRGRFNWYPPGWSLYWLYVIFSAISIFNAQLVLPAGFEVWKMVKMYLIFVATYNYLDLKRNFWPLVNTFAVVTFFMLLVGLYQKYFTSYYQIPSTMPHQNSLVMYATMFGTVFLGTLLNERCSKFQYFVLLAAFGSASLLILFALSRGGLICYIFGVALTAGITLLFNGFTQQRVLVLGSLAILVAIPAIIYAPHLYNRFVNAPESSKLTRINLAKAAVRMANSNFFGIGLNNFSEKSSPRYDYNKEQNSTFFVAREDQGAIVETTYLLVAAECGWGTLLILLWWLFYYFRVNFGNLLAYRRLPGFGMTAGLFGGLAANYVQSALEWVLKQYNNYYQLMIMFAVVALMLTVRKVSRGCR
ncbi:O-antigen ligase [Victivallis sp. Marseille-Q1083]|uniref:O-antigen ligase family protein n=1 Tax=Victivallis sp. Marseille-Q1083 TaxID=2717288 RepID=UPI00158CB414|nr:hypothetical protein [Victivallis sp. Marseille-Q1083]